MHFIRLRIPMLVYEYYFNELTMDKSRHFLCISAFCNKILLHTSLKRKQVQGNIGFNDNIYLEGNISR